MLHYVVFSMHIYIANYTEILKFCCLLIVPVFKYIKDIRNIFLELMCFEKQFQIPIWIFVFLLRDFMLPSLRGQLSLSSGFVTPDELIHRNILNHKDVEEITSY